MTLKDLDQLHTLVTNAESQLATVMGLIEQAGDLIVKGQVDEQ